MVRCPRCSPRWSDRPLRRGFTMRKPTHLPLFAAIAGLALTAGVRADDKPVNDKINTKIANVRLTDADGKSIALHDLKDKKAIVVVFLSFDCPVSTKYAPTLAEL